MNKPWLKVVAGLALFSVFSAASADESVRVIINTELNLQWEQPVRLNQVLTNAVDQGQSAGVVHDTYWPAARLVDASGNAQLAQQQQRIVNELTEVERHWVAENKPERARLAAALRTQVNDWQLAYQPFRAISFERSRQDIDSNPLLPAGMYHLLLPSRPQEVHFYGATQGQPMDFKPGQTLRGYLKSQQDHGILLSGFNAEQARVISVGGETKDLDWAYYNAAGDELLPGQIVWLGARRNVFPKAYRHLHDEIPALLRHWVGDDSTREVIFFEDDTIAPSATAWERLDYRPSRTDYGGVGLMQTPTARMAPEGEANLMYSDTDEYRRYSVSMQVLPWMEATAFYTRIPNRLYSPNPEFSGSNILTDKGFDVKFRVWKESYWMPELAVGLRDFAGTGLFDGEYLVGNKRVGPLDFSLGMGFGRQGRRDNISNPLCEVSDSFCSRARGTSGTGSQLEYGKWFRGPAALFGGVEYQTPYDPVRIKVEYDSNDYSRDRAGVPINPRTPWNVGVHYRPFDWLDTQVSYQRGDTLMFNFSISTNFSTLSQVRMDRPRVAPKTPEVESTDDVNWNHLSRQVSSNRTIAAPRIQLREEDEGEVVTLIGHPWLYRDTDELLDRTARIMAAELPESVKTYEIQMQSANQPLLLNTVDANAFKRRINNEDAGKSVYDTGELFERRAPAMELDDDDWVYDFERRRRVGWGLKPFFNQDFGSPETFHFYQLGVNAFASSWLTDNLHVFGELGVNIKNNYDRFKFERDPFDLPLPRVRSDFRLHATNDLWLDSLQLTYYRRLSENVYGMAYGGYLERFFSGVGGEVMYRQVDSPWAFGLNLNRVRQRDYEGWAGLLEYETTTGHASVYYQMPWLKDSRLQFDFGRFLAGDYGVGVTFARRFDSGVIVSAYASFTDVRSEDYGEGSFTHGFQINVPFDLIGVRPTRQRVGMSWSPMSRDGGQPLWRRVSLYGLTDDRAPFYNR